MEHPLYVIGIDGGGTKTSAVLCAIDGAILAEAEGGPSNCQVIGVEKTAAIILDLIHQCCHIIGCNVSQIGATVAGLAGAGRPNDQQRILDELLRIANVQKLTLNRVAIESDARIALEGAFKGKPGIIVIAGTGSIVFGKDEKGKIYRAGGWGRLIGDEGSGYSIGREAFRAVAKMLDGRGEKTKLIKLLSKKFGLGTQEAIIDALYQQNFDIAGIIPIVIEAAMKGDRIAKRLLSNASMELVDVISAVIANMHKGKNLSKKLNLAFAGSLLANDNFYSKKVRSVVRRHLPQIRINEQESSPVVGAALMAIKEFLTVEKQNLTCDQ